MTERRRRRLAPARAGASLLFFGARREELPYFGPLMKLPARAHRCRARVLSRPDQAKVRAGPIPRARAEVEEWPATRDTFVYVCGHKRMEAGVLDAFRDICSPDRWAALRQDMLRGGRLHTRPTGPESLAIGSAVLFFCALVCDDERDEQVLRHVETRVEALLRRARAHDSRQSGPDRDRSETTSSVRERPEPQQETCRRPVSTETSASRGRRSHGAMNPPSRGNCHSHATRLRRACERHALGLLGGDEAVPGPGTRRRTGWDHSIA